MDSHSLLVAAQLEELDRDFKEQAFSQLLMKNLTRGILFIIVGLGLALGPALHAAPGDVYAAVAFSPSSGTWGYGNGYSTKSEAIARARRECGHRDAKTNWCKNSWIALAISNTSAGGWGSAWGETPEIARAKAMAECRARNPDAHVVLCVSANR
jgi:serine/threonine-protein kinase